jgi:excisionase family DNA binding protein
MAVADDAAGPRGERDARVSRSRLLTATDLAERRQVPTDHVYRLTREGALPAIRLGRYYRYRLDAIEAWELAGGVGEDAGTRRGPRLDGDVSIPGCLARREPVPRCLTTRADGGWRAHTGGE